MATKKEIEQEWKNLREESEAWTRKQAEEFIKNTKLAVPQEEDNSPRVVGVSPEGQHIIDEFHPWVFHDEIGQMPPAERDVRAYWDQPWKQIPKGKYKRSNFDALYPEGKMRSFSDKPIPTWVLILAAFIFGAFIGALWTGFILL